VISTFLAMPATSALVASPASAVSIRARRWSMVSISVMAIPAFVMTGSAASPARPAA
jgi:hypothetical protein